MAKRRKLTPTWLKILSIQREATKRCASLEAHDVAPRFVCPECFEGAIVEAFNAGMATSGWLRGAPAVAPLAPLVSRRRRHRVT